jgi:Cu(I)/Ag(I) efflux system membrane fusion protein
MNARIVAMALVPAVALGLAAGYLLGHRAAQAPGTAQQPAVQAAGGILYYRNPMGLPDTSPVPKKDPMGMDYVPVRAGDALGEGQVRVSTERQQKLGVRLEAAHRTTLADTLQLAGTLQADERRLASVNARVEGYVTALRVAATGSPVRKGQVLLEAWSPDYQAAQQEYRVAARTLESLGQASAEARTGAGRVLAASAERLRNWGMGEAELAALRAGGEPQAVMLVRATGDGVVVDKPARVGLRFMPGEPLYQLADLSSVWVMAEVHEQDLAQARVGAAASASLVAWPGRHFTGRVEFVSPVLNPESRTAQLRIAFANPRGELKPGMYADVELHAPLAEAALTIPASAVIDTGLRQMAFVERGPGLFERRTLRLGRRGDGRVQVLDGLVEGERVVVEGNFLVDAESNLDAATRTLEH